MATTTPVTAVADVPKKTSLLQKVGSDVRKVFEWLGSAKGQGVIAAGEAVAVGVYPPASGIIAIANTGLTEIIKMEAMAVAAGQQNGSGVTKSAAVLQTLTPEILAYAEANKLPTPTAEKIQAASNSLVAFLNALSA